MSGVPRVSIPSNVKKTIQDIKEIAGNHSDEEIYAMLKECSMDPNETAQKLLFQDTFHEVKRRRDKRKENFREVADTRWRPTTHGRGGRIGRGSYASRFTSHDTDSRRNIGAGKEIGISKGEGKDFTSTALTMSLATEHKSTIPLSSTPNGPIIAEPHSSNKHSFSVGASKGLTDVIVSKGGSSFGDGKYSLSSSGQSSSSTSVVSASGAYASSSDQILLPSDGHSPGAVGAIKCEIRTPRSVVDTTVGRGVIHDILGSESHVVNGKVQELFHEIVVSQVVEAYQAASPSSSITGSRPSSNYSSRSQNPSTSIKAGPAKEWKPKSTTFNPTTASGVLRASSVDFNKEESATCAMPVSNPMFADDCKKIQKKLKEFIISDAKHVIIPDHLQVSESERSGLSFGSFDSNFTFTTRFKNEPAAEEIRGESLESSRDIKENVDEFPLSTIGSPKIAEGNSYEIDQQPIIPANQPEETDIPSSLSPSVESNQSKFEASLNSGLQRSIIHNTPVYPNFGFVPPMLGSHFPAFESADPHAHETARIPNFVVPQPFDPSGNYYASIYRPAIDGDGRFSPLLPQAVVKYNGTVATLSNQTGQTLQESGNSMVLSSAGSIPLAPQAAGVVHTSAAACQQPVPLFRQPAGVHISHYPPNYVHYSQYFSPFYAPPPAAIHHFLGNAAAFHQQPSTGNIFPLPTATTGANHVKYPLPQYKPGTNGGPPGQGVYGLNPFVYSPAVSGGNSAISEDLTSSQFKDNSVFNNGQQSEGSAVWMSPAARDISSFQAGSFYNVPQQGQPVAFAPTQAGHGAAAFTGIYHPAHSVAAGSAHPLLQQPQPVGGSSEIGGPPVGVYQPPHRASQINWVNNY